MKKFFLFFLLVFFFSINTYSQYVHKIKADSVLITNDSCNAELNLENSTKNVNGFLYNKGKGRTEFRKGMVKINDSTYVIGNDTLKTNPLSGSSNYIWNTTTQQANSNFNISGNGVVGGLLTTGNQVNINGLWLTENDGFSNSTIDASKPLAIRAGGGSTNNIYIGNNNPYTVCINSANNRVGIGGNHTPAYTLDVNGTGRFGSVFSASSGSLGYNALTIAQTINQTGTANGNIYGLYYNPTLTSVLGTHYFMHANTGSNVLNGTTGYTRFGNDNTNLANLLVIDPYSPTGGSLMTVTGSNFPRSVMKVDLTNVSVYAPALFSITGTSPYIGGQSKPLFDIDIVQNNNAYNLTGYKAKILRTAATYATYDTKGFEADVDGYGGNTYGFYSKAVTSAASPAGKAYAFYGEAGLNYFADKVGIGTPYPQYKLDVNGESRIQGTASAIGNALEIWNLGSPVVKFLNNGSIDMPLAGMALGMGTINSTYPNPVIVKNSSDKYLSLNNALYVAPTSDNILVGSYTDNGNKFQVYGTSYLSGNVGIGTTSPTAPVDVKASTTSNAQIRRRAGVDPASPNDGEDWYDGTNLKFRAGSTTYTMAKTLTATATLNFNSTSPGTSSDLTITVNGAADGDVVSLGIPNASIVSNGCFTAWVSAANTIKVRFTNNDLTNALDPASGTFRVSILKY